MKHVFHLLDNPQGSLYKNIRTFRDYNRDMDKMFMNG